MWLGILIGFGAFLLLSFAVNMFDSEFREAVSRVALGLVVGIPFVLALLSDRVGVIKGQRLSPTALRRFTNMNMDAFAWVFSYKNRGIMFISKGDRRDV